MENFKDYLELSITKQNEGEVDEAKIILKALIIKGTILYDSELNINLAIVYYYLGNALLEKVEDETEFLGNG